MPQLAESVFGRQPEDPIIGEVRLIASGYAADDIIRSSAASGGVATALIAHLFKANKIDSCYCTSGKAQIQGLAFYPEMLMIYCRQQVRIITRCLWKLTI